MRNFVATFLMWIIRSSQVHFTWTVLLDLNGIVGKKKLLSDGRIVLHKISGGRIPTTTQQLYSCKFNLESNPVFPIKPVIAVWGGGWGRGCGCFNAWISSWETLSIWTNKCSKVLVKTGHQWAYLATGSSLAGVPGIKKSSCWCSEKSTRTNPQWCRSIFFLPWWYLTKTGTTGVWSRGFKPGLYFFSCRCITALPQILQPRVQPWGPSLSLHVQHFHWSLPTQAACFAAGITIFFKRVISTTYVFFPQHKKYTLIKNVSRQLALVCQTKGSSAFLWRGKGIPVTEEFVV